MLEGDKGGQWRRKREEIVEIKECKERKVEGEWDGEEDKERE